MEYKDEEDHFFQKLFEEIGGMANAESDTEILTQDDLIQIIEEMKTFFEEGDEEMLNKSLKSLTKLFNQPVVPCLAENVLIEQELYTIIISLLASKVSDDTAEITLSLTICLLKQFRGFGEALVRSGDWALVAGRLEEGPPAVRTRAAAALSRLMSHRGAGVVADSERVVGALGGLLGGRSPAPLRVCSLSLGAECLRVAMLRHRRILRHLHRAFVELGDTQETVASELGRAACVRGMLNLGRRGGPQLRLVVREGCVGSLLGGIAGCGEQSRRYAYRLLALAFGEVDPGFLAAEVGDVPLAAFAVSLSPADPNMAPAVRAMAAAASAFDTVREQCARPEVVRLCARALPGARVEGKAAIVSFLRQTLGAIGLGEPSLRGPELLESLVELYGDARREIREEIEEIIGALFGNLPEDSPARESIQEILEGRNEANSDTSDDISNGGIDRMRSYVDRQTY